MITRFRDSSVSACFAIGILLSEYYVWKGVVMLFVCHLVMIMICLSPCDDRTLSIVRAKGNGS